MVKLTTDFIDFAVCLFVRVLVTAVDCRDSDMKLCFFNNCFFDKFFSEGDNIQ